MIINTDEFSGEWIKEENVKKLIEACLDGRLRLTRGRTVESALRDIMSDWYNTTYRVAMDNDLIDDMSPGKKALVLLKMLINLAESKCPILIDQPEDDLDNRSIFDELIPFIKRKKIDRQIIIVTHNANVVLGGDAEEEVLHHLSETMVHKHGAERTGHRHGIIHAAHGRGTVKEHVPNHFQGQFSVNEHAYDQGVNRCDHRGLRCGKNTAVDAAEDN